MNKERDFYQDQKVHDKIYIAIRRLINTHIDNKI